jgi:mannose-6-phosphate isomerase
MLYPLKFSPLFKEKIWGGDKIRTRLGLDFSPLPNCGEAWLLSGVTNDQTLVSNGFLAGNELNEVLEIYMDELVGEKVYKQYGNQFPILVKVIDARDWLSIQVHPDDILAEKRGIGRGKTEMWYILDADPGAALISGFNRELSKESYLAFAKDNRFREIMNVVEVAKNDVFFIPAGRVHALGPGILLAEIQQTSDTTYRVYDWDRVDAKGNPRELHTKEAVDAFDFAWQPDVKDHPAVIPDKPVQLVNCPYFTTSILNLSEPMEYDNSERDCFVLLIGTAGTTEVIHGGTCYPLLSGEAMLIPAIIETVELIPRGKSTILEVTIG